MWDNELKRRWDWCEADMQHSFSKCGFWFSTTGCLCEKHLMYAGVVFPQKTHFGAFANGCVVTCSWCDKSEKCMCEYFSTFRYKKIEHYILAKYILFYLNKINHFAVAATASATHRLATAHWLTKAALINKDWNRASILKCIRSKARWIVLMKITLLYLCDYVPLGVLFLVGFRFILYHLSVGMICTLFVIQKLLQNEITNQGLKLFWASFPNLSRPW